MKRENHFLPLAALLRRELATIKMKAELQCARHSDGPRADGLAANFQRDFAQIRRGEGGVFRRKGKKENDFFLDSLFTLLEVLDETIMERNVKSLVRLATTS